MQHSGRCIIFGCLLGCVTFFGLGVVTGYFSIPSRTAPKAETQGLPQQSSPLLQSYQNKCQRKIYEAKNCEIELPRNYVAYHLNGKTITVDGKLDEEAWKEVDHTEDFLDIRGIRYPKPKEETRVKIRWDDTHVYVGAWLKEDKVWATYDVKDSRIYQENAFEVFFDVERGLRMYKEIEINALGTTWDLMLTRAYDDGGDFVDWEGISAKGVYTDGLVNIPSKNTTYWSVEMAFPFEALSENTTRAPGPAEDNEVWFMIMARTEYPLEINSTNGRYQQVPGSEASWYSWNPTGEIALHLPNRWGLLQFRKGSPMKNSVVKFDRWIMYKALFDIFEAQKARQAVFGSFVTDLVFLNLPPYITMGSCFTTVTAELVDGGFKATVAHGLVKGHINQNRYTWFTNP
ncbi:hypothetical protein LOTGIDRAFT_233878 [Lottia gigantea]|uniref:Carbohydrate-binding domain-containing protein n=1 Tax=Lottia gigantea TaxID=225164 RepID=V3ZFT0_LOTGI|nr:hypothetical protein LOTGIDRAFT_233878 [Lottia gigantea]ESO90043.1 hypothetical protein LOTGIDRAFT_233878 [Lottia gigantea]